MQPQASRGPDDARQQSLDFLRGEQLRLLQDCELPKGAQDKTGHGVRATVLKAVLVSIDHFGRGRSGGAFASVATLAAAANVGPRTATRAIEVLQSLGLICVTNDGPRYGHVGSPTNRYTIVWSELALLVDRQPISRAPRAEHSAPALGPGRPGDRPERPGDRPERPGGAQIVTTNDQETYLKRRLSSVVPSAAAGARKFFEDEVAAVRARANRINDCAPARTLADRELVLKLAILWEDGELPDDAIEQVLESFSRKRAAGEPVRRPMAWLWTAVKNQAWRHNLHLERLLACTDFPRELLLPPGERVAPATEE